MRKEPIETNAIERLDGAAVEPRHANVYEPLTPAGWERRVRQVAGRLLVAIDEHNEACEAEASARADRDRAYLTAHLYSLENHPKRTIPHHDTYAKKESLEEQIVVYALEKRRKALDTEMHSLRQILYTLNTNAQVMGHVT